MVSERHEGVEKKQDEILIRQKALETLVREMVEGTAKDFSDLRKELRLTLYIRGTRKIADPVNPPKPSTTVVTATPIAPTTLVDPVAQPIDEEAT